MNRSRSSLRAPVDPARLVYCPWCGESFDLFAASWCRHRGSPSKVCPDCSRCICEHPDYGEPRYWKTAPLGFRRRGFERLFVHYV